MDSNIIYFTGVHGTGKSTLINSILEYNPSLELRQKQDILKHDDTHERNMLRAVRHYQQRMEDESYALAHPEKILLRDRSILDNDGYTRGFHALGWMTDTQSSAFRTLFATLFIPNHVPRNIVFVDPPLEFIIANIHKRWKETGIKKWREDDFEYLAAVRKGCKEACSAYEGNVLHLEATEPQKRKEQVLAWIDNKITKIQSTLSSKND